MEKTGEILAPKATVKMHNVLSRGKLSTTVGKEGRAVTPYQNKIKQIDALGREIGKASVVRELNKQLLDNPTLLTRLVKSLINEAIKGNVQATQEIMNRTDGKVAEIHKIDTENPVQLIFTPALQMLQQNNYPELIGGAEPQRETATFAVESQEIKEGVCLPNE